jgi:ATP-binding cassette subfamily B protein
MIDPDAGAVLLDDLDLRQLTREALHGSVTYAFDRPALLGATIAESIGLRTTPVEPTVIAAAARAACAAEFITRLPAGYATPLRAAPMSGGEMQRLGLARAFAHPARVLVLDDATSSLDTVTEHKISTALAAAAGRTRIVLARRASTAAHSDRVLWFDSGRIRGDGIHQDLWADPAYRAVFEAAPVRANVEFACRAAAFAL